ncbi:MAG: proline--tRNA ligase [Anaerolineae bacterium]|nr:proline--tRNA ligase [Anaerolineae bacterium]
MKISQLFGRTLRQPPADAERISHQLAVRAALIRPLAAGIYTYMPIGYRVVRRIEAILREEMEALGAQEMLMPVLNPAEVWQATGRWETTGEALMRLKDRSGRDYAMAMTHEEVVTDLALREIHSYRDLPRVIFHIQTKIRDEPRPRGGLLRVREFRMKDAYSLHPDAEDIDRFYPHMVAAYHRIFERCGLRAIAVEADTGMMGGADSHEFMLPNPHGEDEILVCPGCGYAANAERATFHLQPPAAAVLAQTEAVETPNCPTIADVAAFVGVPARQTLKVVLYTWERPDGSSDLLFAMIRGDLEVNETKLLNHLGGGALRPATEEEIRAVGAVPGYASPVGFAVRMDVQGQGLLVVADRSVESGTDFVAGANREGYHLTGVNYPRDFSATLLVDIAQARAGYPCAHCGEALAAQPTIELGHCFKLGTRYSASMGVTYLDAEGQERLVVMGSYGIGVGRLLAAVIEAHHDDYGIVWPPALAPFDVHLVTLAPAPDDPEAIETEKIYGLLRGAGFAVLYDDRSERAGVKFADADLIGCPVRITVSRRSLEAGGVEIKLRWEKDREVYPVDGLPQTVAGLLDRWPAL